MSEPRNGDVELKSLLIQSLTANGILTRLQAQLRAAVFLALEKHNYHESIPPANSALKAVQSSTDGLILFSLVADFLSCSGLDNTLEVFMHEANLNNISLITRDGLLSRLGLPLKRDASALASVLNSCINSTTNVLDERASHSDAVNKANGIADFSDGSSSSTAEGAVHSDAVHDLEDSHSEHDSDRTSDSQQSLRSGRGVSAEPTVDTPDQPNDHSVLVPDPRLTSTDRDYEDDFVNAVSPTVQPDDDDGGQNSKTFENGLSPNLGSVRTSTPVLRASPKFEELLSRSSSRDGLSSTLRIFARRIPTDENKSDIDDDDDDEIPEILKDYSVGGDSIDQTIDSDDSLGLDHAEDVKSAVHSKRLSPRV